jgi:hypothetical protein
MQKNENEFHFINLVFILDNVISSLIVERPINYHKKFVTYQVNIQIVQREDVFGNSLSAGDFDKDGYLKTYLVHYQLPYDSWTSLKDSALKL